MSEQQEKTAIAPGTQGTTSTTGNAGRGVGVGTTTTSGGGAGKGSFEKGEESPSAFGQQAKGEKDALILDVFPIDAETPMDEVEKGIRSISMPSVTWGEKFQVEPVAFGINKLRVQAIIEGGKVETQEIQDRISHLLKGAQRMCKSVEFVAYTKC